MKYAAIRRVPMFRFRSSSHTSIIQSIFIEYTLGSIPPPWIPVTTRMPSFPLLLGGISHPKILENMSSWCLFVASWMSVFFGAEETSISHENMLSCTWKTSFFNPGIMEVLRHLPTADKLTKSSPESPLKLESHFGGFQFHVQKTQNQHGAVSVTFTRDRSWRAGSSIFKNPFP